MTDSQLLQEATVSKRTCQVRNVRPPCDNLPTMIAEFRTMRERGAVDAQCRSAERKLQTR